MVKLFVIFSINNGDSLVRSTAFRHSGPVRVLRITYKKIKGYVSVMWLKDLFNKVLVKEKFPNEWKRV